MGDTYASRRKAARDKEIATLLKLGRLSMAHIARRCDVSTSVVERVKREIGLTGPPRRPLTDEQRQRALDMFADGASRNEVARTLGCTESVLRTAFPEHHWTMEQRVQFEKDTGIRDQVKINYGRKGRGL